MLDIKMLYQSLNDLRKIIKIMQHLNLHIKYFS